MTSFADPYLYPETNCLRNKLGIRDKKVLDRAERLLVHERIRQGAPLGLFDLPHLCVIHRHLFQDVYDWAGEIRVVNISKDGDNFASTGEIEIGMGFLHRRLAGNDFLRGMSKEIFAHEAAQIVGQVNYLHPFREGNGRTQLQYLKQLAAQAGHGIDLRRFRGKGWIDASRESHRERYEPMRSIIFEAIVARRN